VAEVRRAVPDDDFREQADLLHHRLVECGRVELALAVRVCQSMSRSEAARYSTVMKPWLNVWDFLIFSTS